MGELERKAFLYTAQILEGLVVDWSTGRVSRPKGQ